MTEEKIVKSRRKSKIKIGDKFGRLEVLKNLGIIKRNTCFKCRCDCGTIKNIAGYNLHSGHTKSCGCLDQEQKTKHGMSRTPEYQTWYAMIHRCTNSKDVAYKNYGGRGITVCPEWSYSFENFFKDMGEKPKSLTLERKNNELGYFKENCKWATYTEQMRNRRLSKKNKTGIKGVYWNKRCQKYLVHIGANSKTYFVGFFADIRKAKAARLAAEHEYWLMEKTK